MTNEEAVDIARHWSELVAQQTPADELARRAFEAQVAAASSMPTLDAWLLIGSDDNGPALLGVANRRLFRFRHDDENRFVTDAVPVHEVRLTTVDKVIAFAGMPGVGFRSGRLDRTWLFEVDGWPALGVAASMEWPEREWSWRGQRYLRFVEAIEAAQRAASD
jgi:hypothetical protein